MTGEELLGRMVARGMPRPREADLVVRVNVRGQRIAEVAEALGLERETAKKALQRARRSLRERRSEVEAMCVSPPANDTTLPE